MAKLYFRYGAMNSGKTTALMQVAYNYKERGMRVLILKPAIDTKGQDSIISRLGISCKVDQLVTPEMDVVELVRANEAAHGKIACVLCDESQFFTPEQADQLFLVTVDLGIPVICYGLRADFMMRGFPGSTRLLEFQPLRSVRGVSRRHSGERPPWRQPDEPWIPAEKSGKVISL